ncbi:MAG: glycoside hydrolase family 3 C-terminal domain-containing protein [Clostridia bacterium]|nr:glycoside hydrolase family 3 C-terminal domain-containing protein [Clostridia bacterium]
MDYKGLTYEEKISLLSGATAWTTTAFPKIGLPSIKLTDGANGVRNGDLRASCFPSPVAVASSFDVDAVYFLGKAMAKECKHFGTNILLAPSMNIKRSPLCGRNFGYYSEDPVVSGEIAAAFVRGVQSEGVGACLKHFAVYNQETQRMSSECIVDETVIDEIYLKAFMIAVKKSDPACVMTSYNFCNGTHASQNKKFITDKLRNEWGFNGIVISDWGGVYDRVEALKAGLDLEMPVSRYGNEKISKALHNGKIDPLLIDQSVERIINTVKKYSRKQESCDFEFSKKIAYEVAAKSIVLLKNDDNLLPLVNVKGRVSVIGEGAIKPKIQGGGCDNTNLLWNTDFISELKRDLPDNKIVFEKGYSLDTDKNDENLMDKAVRTARDSDVVIFFIALPESYESEGYDRKNLYCPKNQLTLLNKILKVNRNTVVILQNGAPVDVRKIVKARAVIESYLLGGIWGKALSAVVFGKICPSGKLAETFPLRLEDTPCYFDFPGVNDKTIYSEGLFVGYRYYLSKKMKVAFPFGYGLSYSKFDLDDIRIDKRVLRKGKGIDISFTVKNSGSFFGGEVVQVYLRNDAFGRTRPEMELKKFLKCYLKSGEKREYKLHLSEEDFAVYSDKCGKYVVKDGAYNIMIGTSSVDIKKKFKVAAKGFEDKILYSRDTRIGEIIKTKEGKKIVEKYLLGYLHMAMFGNFNGDITFKDEITNSPFFTSIMNDMPLRALCNFTNGSFTDENIESILNLLNK